MEYCSHDGKLMGIPFVALNSVMFYNKDMFEEAGVTKVPETWEELREAAKKLTQDKDGDGETDQWGMMYEMDDYWQPLSYIIQAGADMWKDVYKRQGEYILCPGGSEISYLKDAVNEYDIRRSVLKADR